MIAASQILTILLSTGIPVLLWWLNKPKHREETESIVVNKFKALTEAQSEEIERLNIKVKRNEIKIQEAEKVNEECEDKHAVTELQLKHLIKQIDLNNLPKSTVFVLDDNRMVIMDFKNRFADILAVDCRFFSAVDDFLLNAKTEQPPILILDYMLGTDTTAEDVIKELGYVPEVFIMSQDKSIQLRIREMGMQFFYKDDNYVRKIAKAVIQHLLDKV